MSLKTIIAWTDHTFNIAWGCVKISPGCKNCYADTLSARYGHDVWGPKAPRRTFGLEHWCEPVSWNTLSAEGRPSVIKKDGKRLELQPVRGAGARHLVFSSSMCDWGEDHPTIEAEREKLWPLIKATQFLDWQLLTKRADRLPKILPKDWSIVNYPNVWLGVSIENNDYAWRANHLRDIDAAVRFVSYEPALGLLSSLDLNGIDWVIYGGESGPGYREHKLEWPRAMRHWCKDAGVAFFYKQSSARRTEMGTTLDGQTIREFPTPRTLPLLAKAATRAAKDLRLDLRFRI